MDLFTNPDLFRYINEYTDLRSLCDTCSVFATLKQYIHYKLNEKYSFMYYDDISSNNGYSVFIGISIVGSFELIISIIGLSIIGLSIIEVSELLFSII